MLRLSRLDITGPLGPEAPRAVRDEVARVAAACGAWSGPGEALAVSLPLSREGRRALAAYVNPAVPLWPFPALVAAFNFLARFGRGGDPRRAVAEHPECLAGDEDWQTPESPIALTPCLLYRVLRDAGVPTSEETTPAQMRRAARCLFAEGESARWAAALAAAGMFSAAAVARAAVAAPEDFEPAPPGPRELNAAGDGPFAPNPEPEAARAGDAAQITYDVLERAFAKVNSVPDLQRIAAPTTAVGAVALAAVVCGRDVSAAADVFAAFAAARRGEAAGPRLDEAFNPLFPPSYYDPKALVRLAVFEGAGVEQLGIAAAPGRASAEERIEYALDWVGGEPRNLDIVAANAYTFLQEASLIATFHEGPQPNAAPATAVDFTPTARVPPGELLTFGVKGEPLASFRDAELRRAFETTVSFANPAARGADFPPAAIAKLRAICWRRGKRELAAAIAKVEAARVSVEGRIKDFKAAFAAAPPEGQQALRRALLALMHAGMAMRGWTGGEELMSEAPQLLPTNKNLLSPSAEVVAVHVTEALAVFAARAREAGALGDRLERLPLLLFQDGKMCVSNDRAYGLTVAERIAIVKQGEGHNLNSCIRMSSNWLCTSAHRYMAEVGMPELFPLRELRYIA